MEKIFTHKEIGKRIFEATGAKTQKELSALLCLRQSTISSALTNSNRLIPRNWFNVLFDKFRLNPVWLVSGEGEKILKNSIPENFYPEYKEKTKALYSAINLGIDNIKPVNIFKVSEDLKLVSKSNKNNTKNSKEKDFKISTNSLDNSNTNELSFSTGLSENVSLKINTNICTFDVSDFSIYESDKMINVSSNENIRIIEFNNKCMEPIISEQNLLMIDFGWELDFNPHSIFAFCFPNTGLILANIMIENENVNFIFANEQFVNFSCDIIETKKHYLGKLQGTLLPQID